MISLIHSTLKTSNQKFTGKDNNIVLNLEITGSRFCVPTEIQFLKNKIPEKYLVSENKSELKNFLVDYIKYNKYQIITKSAKQSGQVDYDLSTSLEREFDPNNIDWQNWELDLSNDEYVTFREVFSGKEDVDKNKIRKIFNSSNILDISNDHNQVLDVYRFSELEGRVGPNDVDTLIHFDTHSDFKKGNYDDYHIGNWINKLVKDCRLSTIYWVLPDWTKSEKAFGTFWDEKIPDNSKLSTALKNNFLIGPKNQELYVNKSTGEIYFDKKPDDYYKNKAAYKLVKFHKITLNELPEFKNKRKIHLDFCADYFGNRGFDTVNHFNYNYSSKELSNLFNNVVNKLYSNGVRPVLTTMSLSEQYIPPEDAYKIREFFQDIILIPEKKDYLVGYKNSYYGMSNRPIVSRFNNPAASTLFFLDCIDTRSENSDSSIELAADNDKYWKAIEVIKREFLTTNPRKARKILLNMDSLDGVKDNLISIHMAEDNICNSYIH